MFRNIYGVMVLFVALAMTTMGFSCGSGGCSSAPLQPEPVLTNKNSSVATVTVRQGDTPISGIRIEFSRSIVGQAANYEWSATTDENGHARIEIAPGENVSAYYLARAIQNGSQIDSWSSMSIKEGYEVMFDLPIGGEAQVTSSSILPNPNITVRSENILLTE